MIRLHVIGEGQSEVRFVKKVLSSHLSNRQVYPDARAVFTGYDKKLHKPYRGGFIGKHPYQKAKKDITDWLKQDKSKDCRFTTMFDLYALPEDFPGHSTSRDIADIYQKVEHIELELANDINDPRFIPYIQLHEFETLLYSDLTILKMEYLQYERQINHMITNMNGINPETINESPITAPSKRLIKIIPEYEFDKATVGPLLLELIGLDVMRKKCRHFNDWVTTLESLNNVT